MPAPLGLSPTVLMPQLPVQLVWFKRDLRVHDHRPLWEAAQRGPVLPLYIVVPHRLYAADFDPAHCGPFIQTSLLELRDNLARLGQPLVTAWRQPEAMQQAQAVLEKHGGGRPPARRRSRPAIRRGSNQLGFDWGGET